VKQRSILAAWLVCAFAATAAAADKFPEPTGFGKAKFGIAAGEAVKLYPKLRPTKGTEEALAKGQHMVLIYEMENEKVGSLKACRVQFRFFNGEFYEAQFFCPDRAKIAEYLKKTYGEPTKASDKAVYWIGKEGAVSLSPRSGAFGFSDLKRSQVMQASMFAQLQKMGVGATPGAGSAPAETPAPAQAPAPTPAQPQQ
jgi:hypothetical protein